MQRSLSPQEEHIATIIVDAAITVHKALGPGLLESIYEACLYHELTKRKLRCQRQVALPIMYDGIVFEEGLRLDLLVEDLIICELKATDQMHPVYMAQIMSHLKLAHKRLGFLMNFNVPLMKNGIRRVVI
ncbi:GxxExxY protein [Kouleothrix aurantiaca]|uniref:GxxExxY protein n=1 Tax=Kouleothrix aurantiaca TaxID=186479 RepID=A0A0P9D930_9CHLR|nr:GxxExxY protein [Kouleothrix aurantiaca]